MKIDVMLTPFFDAFFDAFFDVMLTPLAHRPLWRIQRDRAYIFWQIEHARMAA
jgi:hypothetical protein